MKRLDSYKLRSTVRNEERFREILKENNFEVTFVQGFYKIYPSERSSEYIGILFNITEIPHGADSYLIIEDQAKKTDKKRKEKTLQLQKIAEEFSPFYTR